MRPERGRGGGAASPIDAIAALLLGAVLVALGATHLTSSLETSGGDAGASEERRLERQLAAAPFDPPGWLRLAAIEAKASPAEAGAALRLSILTGPREPSLLQPRLDLALALWPALDGETRELVLEQARQAWSSDAAAAAALARRHDALPVLRSALDGRPDDLARLDALR